MILLQFKTPLRKHSFERLCISISKRSAAVLLTNVRNFHASHTRYQHNDQKKPPDKDDDKKLSPMMAKLLLWCFTVYILVFVLASMMMPVNKQEVFYV